MDLIDHVLERIRKKIPSGSVMIIPPGNNMSATFRFLISKHSMNKISVRAYSESVGEKKSISLYSSARKVIWKYVD